MNNLKSMLSKSSPSTGDVNSAKSPSDEAFERLSIEDFLADVMKEANTRASENYADVSSMNWKTDVNSFRSGASFALKWFSDKIETSE